MPPRSRSLPVASPFHDLSPEERLRARRALRLRLLAALDKRPMTALALRLGLGEEEAGGLVATLDDLVAAGEIAAIGHGAYARVPWGPQTRPVIAAPLHDLVHAALVHLASAAHRKSASVRIVADFLGLSLEQVASSLQHLELAGMVTFSDANGEWIPIGALTSRRVRKGIEEGIDSRITAVDRDAKVNSGARGTS